MSNPILNENRFQSTVLEGEPMTVQGTINKVGILFACLLMGAGFTLYMIFGGMKELVPIFSTASAIIGFVLVLISSFNIKMTKYLAAPYALFEGIFIGSVSYLFETNFPGIVLHAVFGTFVVLGVMLFLYKTKTIQYTDKFAAVLKTSLLSVFAIYLIQIIASFFSRGIPGIFEAGMVGIIFSVVVVVIASMSLIQDFFFIETASQNMLNKDYEWFGAMGLMVTLVWLYMEILRLLAKVNSRR